MPVVPLACPEEKERAADQVEVVNQDDEENPVELATAEPRDKGEIREMPVFPEHQEHPETEETMV